MKAFQNLIAILVICLTAAFIYQFTRMLSTWVQVDENREVVQEHTERLDEVEKAGSAREQKLGRHEQRIEQHTQWIQENQKDILAQEKRLMEISNHLEELRGDLDRLAKDSSTKDEAITALREEIARFKRGYELQAQENKKLKKNMEDLLQRDAEIELRLRALEKVLQGDSPEPGLLPGPRGSPRPRSPGIDPVRDRSRK